MLIAAAVCPHPPLLIPAALGAAAGNPPEELRKLADATSAAVAGLLAAGPDLIAVVGGGPAQREYGAGAAGSLRDFGVDATIGEGEPQLPLSLTVGRWLLERAGAFGPPSGAAPTAGPSRAHADQPSRAGIVFQAVDSAASAADCLVLGAALAARAPGVALLVMGDASARRAREAPGAPDPEAEEYDADVAEALAAADTHWLAHLDPRLDGDLVVAGRAAWQVLAGAATNDRLDGRLLYMAAPYGVTYLVALWHSAAPPVPAASGGTTGRQAQPAPPAG